MGAYKSILGTLCLLSIINIIETKEFIPVYMWSSKRLIERVPALHRISEEYFKDDMLKQVKDRQFVVIFAEETLSPEDFAQRNPSGSLIFSNLASYKKKLYLPNVHKPIEAVKQLEGTIMEIPIKNLSEIVEITETNMLIINLNDAKEAENRLDMLQRHDAYIDSIYGQILKKYENVLALYTGRHTSWIGAENIHSRKSRDLLQTQDEAADKSNFQKTTNVLVYSSYAQYIQNKTVKNVTGSTYQSTNVTNNTIELILTSENLEVKFMFTNANSAGYYELLEPIETKWKNNKQEFKYNLSSNSEMYAPSGFSYHCGDQTFSNPNFTLFLKDFQIQVFFDQILNQTRFNDAYDCVGFTSVPIWSGIFVTTIILIIMTFGITMMMDIRTMDRFDDAKGKTITINAE